MIYYLRSTKIRESRCPVIIYKDVMLRLLNSLSLVGIRKKLNSFEVSMDDLLGV